MGFYGFQNSFQILPQIPCFTVPHKFPPTFKIFELKIIFIIETLLCNEKVKKKEKGWSAKTLVLDMCHYCGFDQLGREARSWFQICSV